jgi:hypothetical protein
MPNWLRSRDLGVGEYCGVGGLQPMWLAREQLGRGDQQPARLAIPVALGQGQALTLIAASKLHAGDRAAARLARARLEGAPGYARGPETIAGATAGTTYVRGARLAPGLPGRASESPLPIVSVPSLRENLGSGRRRPGTSRGSRSGAGSYHE